MTEEGHNHRYSPNPQESKGRRAAIEALAARRGGKITYAGRLVVGITTAGDKVLLYDENNKLLGVDDAPPITEHITRVGGSQIPWGNLPPASDS